MCFRCKKVDSINPQTHGRPFISSFLKNAKNLRSDLTDVFQFQPNIYLVTPF